MENNLYQGEGLSGEFTRFSTLAESVPHSLSHVRNIGFSNGVDLRECDIIDSLACIIGADTWMMLSGGSGTSLHNPVGACAESRRVLTNIILRGCGHGFEEFCENMYSSPKISDDLLTKITVEQENQEKWLKKVKNDITNKEKQAVFTKVLTDYCETESSLLACYKSVLMVKYS